MASERKLTNRQRFMLTEGIAAGGWRLDGRREFHTARCLERRGLGRVTMEDDFETNGAGRAALEGMGDE